MGILNWIFKGSAPNDKTGTPARTAADIINNNFEALNNDIIKLQNPDGVLKYGNIDTDGLNVEVMAGSFEWQIDQVKYFDNPAFSAVLDAASDGFYRKDILLGNNAGGYNIFKGDEDSVAATEPKLFPAGTIRLGAIDVYGSVITGAITEENLVRYVDELTAGRVPFVLDKDVISDSDKFLWNDALSKFEINGINPKFILKNTLNNFGQYINVTPSGALYLKNHADKTGFIFANSVAAGSEPKLGIGDIVGGIPVESQLYVYGGNNGANIDARGSAAVDEANIDLEGNDWAGNDSNSLGFSYFGSNGRPGSVLGYARNKLAQIRFNNTSAALITSINTSGVSPIRFGINSAEIANINDKGFSYQSDFSSVNAGNPRWLVDKAYVDNLLVGVLNLRGSHDASANLFPTTGGSGAGGAILKGDLWYVSVAGILAGKSVNVGDSFVALSNSPAQITGNWNVMESNIGYVPENNANKQNSLTADGTGIKFSTVDAVNAGLLLKANLVSPNFTGTPIAPTATAGTNTTQIATTAFVTGAINTAEASYLKTTGSQSRTSGVLNINNNTNTITNQLQLTNSGASGSQFNGVLNMYNSNNGIGQSIDNSGSGRALYINNSSSGIGINIATNAATTGYSIYQQLAASPTFTLDKNGNVFFAGNVGFGTSSPSVPFDILKNINTTAFLIRNNTNSLYAGNDADGAFLGGYKADNSNVAPLQLQKFGGNVGIGTGTATNPLHIVTTSNIPLKIESSNTENYINLRSSGSDAAYGVLLKNIGNDFGIYHGDSVANSFFIKGSNRLIGIGTENPTNAKLAINGGNPSSTIASLSVVQGAGGTAYGQIVSADASHGMTMRGFPSSGDIGNYGITAQDVMSFYEYGGEFRFYKKNGTLTEQMRIGSDGSVTIPNLAGTGTRTVVVDANGKLSAI